MRKLISFKIINGRIPAFAFEWQNDKDGLPEIFRLKSTEAPNPGLLEAAHEVGKLAAKMVSLNVTDSDAHSGAGFHGVSFDYPKSIDGYKVKINAEMHFPWSGYTFTYVTPGWRVYYSNSSSDFNNTIRDTVHRLLQECWAYIDGNRAQVELDWGADDEQ